MLRIRSKALPYSVDNSPFEKENLACFWAVRETECVATGHQGYTTLLPAWKGHPFGLTTIDPYCLSLTTRLPPNTTVDFREGLGHYHRELPF